MSAAIERHRQDWRISLASSVDNTLRLTGCLETSRVSADFCVSVPDADSSLRLGIWTAARCSSLGFSDPFCGQLFQAVAHYCASPKRAAKLKVPGM
jgi:hypothetical protein